MDRAIREGGARRRMISIWATIGLTTAMLVLSAPNAGAAANTCRARDVTKTRRAARTSRL
jgi:hypothetical protein